MWVMLRPGQCQLAMWFMHILKWLMVMYEWKSSTGDADHDSPPPVLQVAAEDKAVCHACNNALWPLSILTFPWVLISMAGWLAAAAASCYEYLEQLHVQR